LTVPAARTHVGADGGRDGNKLPQVVAADLQNLLQDLREEETTGVPSEVAEPAAGTVAVAPVARQDQSTVNAAKPKASEQEISQPVVARQIPQRRQSDNQSDNQPPEAAELRDLVDNLETLPIDLREPESAVLSSSYPALAEPVSARTDVDGARVFVDLIATADRDSLSTETDTEADVRVGSLEHDGLLGALEPEPHEFFEDRAGIPAGWSLGPSAAAEPSRLLRFRFRFISWLRTLKLSEWRNQRRHRRENRRYSDGLY